MSTFDLTESFVSLVSQQDTRHPDLGLSKDLGKVNVVLTGFAESLRLERDQLSILHVCADSEHPHPALLKHINSLPKDRAYKGQNVSRIKKLIKCLPWPGDQHNGESPQPALMEERLPLHLEQIWPLLPKIPPGDRNAKPGQHVSTKEKHPALPLSISGISLGLALLDVSRAHLVTDTRTLLEDYSAHIYKYIQHNNPCSRWVSLRGAFSKFRVRVRGFLNYEPETPSDVTIKLEALPEPLRTQVLVYKERAEKGFQSGQHVKRLGMRKYKLELGRQANITIENCIRFICLGVGYVPRQLYGDSLDIKDLMKLDVREIEIDETKVMEFYNVLIDPYRERELGRASDYKEVDFDSQSFGLFVGAIATVAAYNGFFHLRKTFLKVYSVNTDSETTKNRKRDMKRIFDREWTDRQLDNLKVKFHRILDAGSFRSDPDGLMRRDARDDLNLCLFYVVLLTLRFFGVRQRNIRESIEGENVVVISRGRVTFQWLEEETKNKKGIIHRMSLKKHGETHADLIDGVWMYHQYIYPFISGARGDKDSPPELLKRRRQAIEGRFYVKIGQDGICVPFSDERDFNDWFRRQSCKFLDFGEMLDEKTKPPSPHFYRGVIRRLDAHRPGLPVRGVSSPCGRHEGNVRCILFRAPNSF
jgi:hypothetical protein